MTIRRPFAPTRFGGRLVLVAFCALSIPSPAYSQLDPAIGKWRLNLAKSTYGPGVTPPKSVTVAIEPAGQGLRVTARTIGGDGQVTETQYTAYVDGNDYAVTGSRDYNSVSLKRTGLIVEGTRKKDGTVVQHYQRFLSPDGKTMTVATTGVNSQGKQISTVAVFDKQLPGK